MLWVLLLVIILMAAAAVLRLVFQVREHGAGPRLTEHFYAVSATAAAVPTINELVHALEELGYDLTCENTTTRNLSGDVSLGIGGELIVRDRRQRGALSVRIVQQGERVTGEIVSKDEGPEFYEEMARYALVALSRKIPELRYAHRGQEPALAASLAGELPERPLGMALL